MNSTAVHVFAGIGAWFCVSWLVAFGFGLARRRARRKRTVELFAAMCEAMDRDDAMGRHPAGRRLHPLGRPVIVLPCQCVLFCESGDRWDAELMALAHVEKCPVARSIRGEAA